MQNSDRILLEGVTRMGDNTLILGQRLSAWCGHAPVLEEDIAIANVALDLIGQTKNWLSLAAEIEGENRSADDFAFLRDNREFRNCLLVEQVNGDYGQTLMRQFLFDGWHFPMLQALSTCTDDRIASIAQKSLKEVEYHRERSGDLVLRLGDGTEESINRMQRALDLLWPFVGELNQPDQVDIDFFTLIGADRALTIADQYKEYIEPIINRTALTLPADVPARKGGKQGLHMEDFGFLLAEMQWLQRAYPGAAW